MSLKWLIRIKFSSALCYLVLGCSIPLWHQSSYAIDSYRVWLLYVFSSLCRCKHMHACICVYIKNTIFQFSKHQLSSKTTWVSWSFPSEALQNLHHLCLFSSSSFWKFKQFISLHTLLVPFIGLCSPLCFDILTGKLKQSLPWRF